MAAMKATFTAHQRTDSLLCCMHIKAFFDLIMCKEVKERDEGTGFFFFIYALTKKLKTALTI